MGRHRLELYVHFVWTTYDRHPLITDDIARKVHRIIYAEAVRKQCTVVAIGGMPDHIHLAVQMPSTVSAGQLMQRVKGASSAIIREQLCPGEFFGWQDGYGGFSFSRSDLPAVQAYIQNQAKHHADGTLQLDIEPEGHRDD